MKTGNLVRISSDEDFVIRECTSDYCKLYAYDKDTRKVGFCEDMKPDIGRYGRIVDRVQGTGQAFYVYVGDNPHGFFLWPDSVLKEVFHTWKLGEKVHIIANCAYIKSVCTSWIPAYEPFLGKRGTISAVEKRAPGPWENSNTIEVRVELEEDDPIPSASAWHSAVLKLTEECLLPIEIAPADKGIEEILTDLYDAHKNHTDCTKLLETYRSITGKQRPEFMG